MKLLSKATTSPTWLSEKLRTHPPVHSPVDRMTKGDLDSDLSDFQLDQKARALIQRESILEQKIERASQQELPIRRQQVQEQVVQAEREEFSALNYRQQAQAMAAPAYCVKQKALDFLGADAPKGADASKINPPQSEPETQSADTKPGETQKNPGKLLTRAEMLAQREQQLDQREANFDQEVRKKVDAQLHPLLEKIQQHKQRATEYSQQARGMYAQAQKDLQFARDSGMGPSSF